MKRTKLRNKKVIAKNKSGHFLLALGAILISTLLNRLYLRYRPIPLSATGTSQSRVGDIPIETPDRDDSIKVIYPNLSIPKLNLTLPIYPSVVKDGKWQTTPKGLSRASTSAPLGHTGNTVIYGHNWPNMLKHLPKLIPGDLITINLNESKIITYTVTYTATVSPVDISLTRSTTDSRLTLYTCAGLLDRDRYVVVAHLN